MAQHDLEKALAHVDQSRREWLKKLFVGTAVAGAAIAAVPLMSTQALAAGKEGEDPGPDGKCEGDLIVGKKSGKCIKKKAP